ncbi:type II toxin-antitoxin system RelE/ParE family toxin [Saccharicrinis aurantiacus]|uniref:type II toxin-antitoxin system RelE/ParE family toxin n=1 Tax=Saccharicrinis aurantiacus TaxID=1849719 RepID=UPI003CD0CCC6
MKIVYTEGFILRLERQLHFIAKDNPNAAKRLKKDLLQKIKTIRPNPTMFRKSIYFEDNTIRDLIFKGYTIVFRINIDQIEVFGFVKYQKGVID